MFLINRGELTERFDAIYYSASNNLKIANETIYPVKKLSDVAILQRGKFSHRPRNDKRFYNGEYPFIQTGDIVKASQTNDAIKFTQTLNELGLSVSKLFQPDVLIITIAANIGDTAILTYPACFPDSLVTISPKNELVDVRYLNVYFKYVKDYLVNLAPQAAQKNINLQQLSPTPVVVPPLEIQSQIISIFETAYNSKKQKETEASQLLASIDGYLLEALGITLPKPAEKKTYFLTNLSNVSGGRFDPFYHQDGFDVYKNPISKYPNRKIGDLSFSIQTGLPVRNDFRVENGLYPYYGANGIIGYMNEFTHIGKYLVVAQDGYIGNHYVVEGKFWASNHNWVMKLDETQVNLNYAKSVLDLWNYNYLVTGAVIPKLTKEALKSIKIPLPPLEKQIEIADHISALRLQARQLQHEAQAELERVKSEVEQMILGANDGF